MALAELLRDALTVLRDEARWHHDALGVALGACVVGLEVDGERFVLAGTAGAPVVEGPREGVDLEVRTRARVVLDLLDAEQTVLDALGAGTLDIRGSTDDLRRAGDLLSIGVHGLVRSPSGPALLARLRRIGGRHERG